MILIAGEALVDMVAKSDNKQEFAAIPGGSAFNVACALGLLGATTTFACPISKDTLGDVLMNTMQRCGVSPYLSQRTAAHTPLALVNVNELGQPSYAFYREGTADRMLEPLNLQKSLDGIHIMHITGFCLNEATDYRQWLKLVKQAKAEGAIISVDPNVRESLISDPDDYRERIKALLAIADVVKVSDEDLHYLYPDITLAAAVEKLKQLVALAIITYGAKGAEAYCAGKKSFEAAQKVEQLVDTVGAGDCFSAAYIYQLYRLEIFKAEQLAQLTKEQLSKVLIFASTAAAINCGRKGCQPPTVDEVNRKIELASRN